MSNIKINKDSLYSIIEELETTQSQISKAEKLLHISLELARDGFTAIEEDSISDYNDAVESIGIAYEKMIGYKTQIGSLVYYFKGIRTILEEFETEYANKDIDDLLDSVDGGKELLSFLHFASKEDGSVSIYFDLDGKKVTISEMVNSFYTYTGASMNANIEGRIMSLEMGTSFYESMQTNLLQGVNGFVSNTLNGGYFSGLDEELLTRLSSEIGANVGVAVTNTPAVGIQTSTKTNLLTMGAAVGAGLLGAYTLTEHLPINKKKYKTREDVTLSIQEMIKSKLQYQENGKDV